MFCSGCGANATELCNGLLFCDKCATDSCTNDLIKEYFHRGFRYDSIVGLLKKEGITMHVRTLKRKLRLLGLRKKGNEEDEDTVKDLIREEMQGPGRLSGYRSIWHSLRLRHHVHVPRHRVAQLMKEIDPDGVRDRRRRRLSRRKYSSPGPNACWHIDGYDKLKPYGFPIHGAVCGYSRRIMWLEVVKSNNDPRVPGKLYLECVKEVGGCPMLVSSDCGSENGIAAAMQCYFRANGEDELAGQRAHRYGSSPANQRIEGWWSFLRRNRTSWWIDLFKDLSESGSLQLGNTYHMECLWFCFSRVLQNDLNKVKDHWNSHYIRRSGHGTVPGVPDIMFYLPEQSGAVDCLVPVSQTQMNEMENLYDTELEDNIYYEYFEYAMEHEGWEYPDGEDGALTLFHNLMSLNGQDN